jgi:hypothetical protein
MDAELSGGMKTKNCTQLWHEAHFPSQNAKNVENTSVPERFCQLNC